MDSPTNAGAPVYAACSPTPPIFFYFIVSLLFVVKDYGDYNSS